MRRMSERDLHVEVKPAADFNTNEPAVVLAIGGARYVCSLPEALRIANAIADIATQKKEQP